MASSTSNIPLVGVSTIPLGDVEEDHSSKDRLKRERTEVKDSLQIGPKKTMANAAEAMRPPVKKLDAFGKIKESGEQLGQVVSEAVSALKTKKTETKELEQDGKTSETQKADIVIEKLDEVILKMQENGKEGSREYARFVKMRDRLQEKLVTHQKNLESLPEAEEMTSSAISAETSETSTDKSGESSGKVSGEEPHWSALSLLGLAPSEGKSDASTKQTRESAASQLTSARPDIETVGRQIASVKSQLPAVAGQIDYKKGELIRAKALMTTKGITSEEKQKLQAQVKQLESEVQHLSQKKILAEKMIAKAEYHADQIVQSRVKKDLGLDLEEEKPSTKGWSVESTEDKKSTFVHSKSVSDGQKEESGSSSPMMKIKSAGGEAQTQEGGMVQGHGPSGVNDESFLVKIASDQSTLLSIQATSNNVKQEARKTEQLLKKMIAAAQSGNWNAVKDALILLSKKVSAMTTQVGAQVAKAMMSYAQQQEQLTKSMGLIDPKSAGYAANMQVISQKFASYSTDRSTASNVLRDILGTKEEMLNLTQSILQRDQQITASLSRG